MITPRLLTPDWLALGVYFVLTLVVGAWAARRHTGSDDLFLAGRSLGPLAVGFSLFASNVSSDTIIGLPGAAYATGISAANYEWMASLVLLVSLVAVYPVLARARVSTMPELMERRFDPRMRRYLSAVTLFLSVVLDTAGTLYAGALVLSTFVPGLQLQQATLGLALFTALYTDVLQTVVLLAGSAALALIVFARFDYSWAEVLRCVPDEHLHLIRPLDDPGVPWLGLLTGIPVACLYYWNLSQHIVQRVLGANGLESAARGALIAGALKLLPLFPMTLPGALAIPLLPRLEQPDKVWPTLVASFVPPGLAGLILAGLLAALMSSCSATLNSSATLLAADFVRPALPRMSSRRLAWFGRAATLLIAAGAGWWAPMIRHFPGLWAYVQEIIAYALSPMLAVALLGMVCPWFGANAALRTLASAHLASAALLGAKLSGWVHLHYSVVGGVVFANTLLLAGAWMLVTRAADRPAPASPALEVVRRDNLPRLPLDVRLGALAVLLGVLGLLLAFG